MSYIFKGRLCGFICDECPEPLSDVTVRLYRNRKDQDVTALAVANATDTFAILNDDQVKAKASSLIAETKTDANGNFAFELSDRSYHGEAFEVDVYCATVPNRKPGRKTPSPVQFSITTVQPRWRQTDGGFVGAWEYCIPVRYWCAIRRRFGAWTICGRVTVCGTRDPIAGVKVIAFDTDWIQDDQIGSATTDGSGKFRIDYLTEDFEKTPLSPLINFELIGGPDLYFRIETPGGTVLMAEPRTEGRTPGRQNVGNCFCVELCIDEPPSDGGNPIPLFTHVGQYRVDPIYNDFTSDGLTTSENLAFTDTIPLIGILPNGNAPDALEYHFEYGEYDPTGTTLGPVSDVDPSMIAPTVIGQLEYFDYDSVTSAFFLRSANYWVNNPGAPVTTIHRNGLPDISIVLNQTVAAGGWIQVPRQSNLTVNGEGLFVGGFVDMVDLDTTKLTSESFDLTAP
ncbi:MAG TPA: carboxypeptidase regulatory-like domain-containing protein, partial [Blastocatellia bacterium]|nr:carboxypeptidase regulatory-like domain-containing protein [Blastocatellia bacterium]